MFQIYGYSFGLALIVPLDGTICGIDQHNLRRIESGVVTEDTLLVCKKFGERSIRVAKRGWKSAGMRILLIEKRENSDLERRWGDREARGWPAINQQNLPEKEREKERRGIERRSPSPFWRGIQRTYDCVARTYDLLSGVMTRFLL